MYKILFSIRVLVVPSTVPEMPLLGVTAAFPVPVSLPVFLPVVLPLPIFLAVSASAPGPVTFPVLLLPLPVPVTVVVAVSVSVLDPVFVPLSALVYVLSSWQLLFPIPLSSFADFGLKLTKIKETMKRADNESTT